MKKQDVYVEVRTKKQAKKLKEVLGMFGEKYFDELGGILEWTKIHNCVYFSNKERMWHGVSDIDLISSQYAKVSIEQLRNILASEHLKEGDVVVSKGKSKFIGIVKSVQLNDDLTIVIYSDNYFKDGVKGCFSGFWNFTRYATKEEKVQMTLLDDIHRCGVGYSSRMKLITEQLQDTLTKRKTQSNEYKVTPKSLEISGDRQAFITMEVHGAGEQFGEAMSEVNDKDFKLVISDKKHDVSTNSTDETPEQKVVKYAESVDWDFEKVVLEIRKPSRLSILNAWEWNELKGCCSEDKVRNIFNKHHPHMELKKAFKEGAEIQVLGQLSNEWITDTSPSWSSSYKYRLRPLYVGDFVSYKSGTIRKVTEITESNISHYKKLDCKRITNTDLLQTLKNL